MPCKKEIVSRADLIRCYSHLDREGMDLIASLLGYQRTQQKEEEKQPPSQPVQTLGSEEVIAQIPKRDKANSGPSYWRMTYRLSSEPDEAVELEVLAESELPQAGEITTRTSPPPKPALAPWNRLWPFIYGVLGKKRSTTTPDVRQLVKLLSSGRSLQRIPYRQRKSWASYCQIIVDVNSRTVPFRGDYGDLCRRVMNFRGREGLDVIVMERGSHGLCRYNSRNQLQPYVLPSAGTPVLILSDLGQYDETTLEQAGWLRFGKRLHLHGLTPVALTPTPHRLWDQQLSRYFYQTCWDNGQRFSSKGIGRTTALHEAVTHNNGMVEQLLTLLSPAIRVEPSLLRAVRLLDTSAKIDVGAEAEIWHHQDVISNNIGFAYQDKAGEKYRQRYLSLPEKTRTNIIDKLAQLLVQYHGHLAPGVKVEEFYNLQCLGFKSPKEMSAEVEHYLKRKREEIEQGGANRQRLMDWVGRVESRLSSHSFAHPSWKRLWVAANSEKLREVGTAVALPDGLDVRQISQLLGNERKLKQYTVRQVGPDLVIEQGVQKQATASSGLQRVGLFHATLNAMAPYVQVTLYASSGGAEENYLVNISEQIPLPKTSGSFRLTTDFDQLKIDGAAKPDWATELGIDHHGLYTEFTVKGITQRMRWINPGTFMMGSPEDEPERLDRETQHEVTLTEGYWLADTPVTQALWQAVMGENPSRFKGQERPVENVSWNDAQEFIERLNQEDDDLGLRLPTEVEWEHACRAGTQTPFSFGENITTDQVNYNGNNPYADGAKGEYRQTTVDVKVLPYNAWGLHQMHGNVWEWCSDRYRSYPAEFVTNPAGPDTGDGRVLRGGSWLRSGRGVRSAFRYHGEPSNRDDNFGFRLARGPKSK